MAGGISLNDLVSVTSAGISDTFSNSKMHTLLITKQDDSVIADRFSQFTSLTALAKIFGYGDVYEFANIYFGFSSNKVASKAELLNVFVYNQKDMHGTLRGAGVETSLATFQTLNGAFSVDIDNVISEVDIDFTGESFSSYSDVATALQTAIQGASTQSTFTNAKVEFNSITGGFVIKGGSAKDTSFVGCITAPTTAGKTDISEYFGLSSQNGATEISGYSALNSITEALNAIADENGAYFNLTCDFELSDDELKEVGSWLNSQNNEFSFVYDSEATALVTNSNYTSDLRSYNGFILNYVKDKRVNAFVSGAISAIDFSQANGNFNVAFSETEQFTPSIDTNDGKIDILEENQANGILKYGKNGQYVTLYGKGNCFGTLTNSINVFVANGYLVRAEQNAIANMFLAQRMVAVRGTQADALITAYITTPFEEAVKSGIIATGAELTTTEEESIKSTFPSDYESAISLLETRGYYFKITGRDLVNKEVTITQAYVANTPAKRIVIANYILGA